MLAPSTLTRLKPSLSALRSLASNAKYRQCHTPAGVMESSVKRTQRDYTLAFKLAVVEQVEKGELTYKEAQRRYGIQGRSTVLVWLRQAWSAGLGAAASSAAMPIDKSAGPLTPEQQIKALQVQLEQAQEKARLFEAVIDVLRKDYGVRVVKKPLGKSSRKTLSRG